MKTSNEVTVHVLVPCYGDKLNPAFAKANQIAKENNQE